MHFIFLMHIDRTHNTSHCLSESFILTESRPGKERIFRIRDFNRNLILFTPFYIFADIHHKRKRAAYMSHHSRLFNPCIPGNSLPVHKDNSCQIHSLEFQKISFSRSFSSKKSFFLYQPSPRQQRSPVLVFR